MAHISRIPHKKFSWHTDSGSNGSGESGKDDLENQLAAILKLVHEKFVKDTGDEELAKDIVQETRIRFWKYVSRHSKSGRAQIEQNLKSYVFKMAHNVFLTSLKKNRGHADSLDIADVEDIIASDDDPERTTLINEGVEEIKKQIELLPSRCSTVMRLYLLEEQSASAIANKLGLPIGAVKSHIHRGRQYLRKALSKPG